MMSTYVPKETEDNLELLIILNTDAEKAEHDDVLENALKIMQKPCDECQIFGDFVASELRGLKKPESKRKLKKLIQQAILRVTDEDDEENSDMILLSSDSSTQLFICSDNTKDTDTEPHNIPTQSLQSYIRGFGTDT